MRFLLQLIFVLVFYQSLPIHGFLSDPIMTLMTRTGNLSCSLDEGQTNTGDYNLCAIRIYRHLSAATNDLVDVIVQQGIWYTNIFRQLIMKNCTGFTETSDIGIGSCEQLPYENFQSMQLCICGTDNCNENISTCRESTEIFSNLKLIDLMPATPSEISCAPGSSTVFSCYLPQSYAQVVNGDICNNFVQNHSVICSIRDENNVEQYAISSIDYDRFLSEQLHELKRVFSLTTDVTLNETNSNVYVQYPGNNVQGRQCICKEASSCNSDLATCAPQVFSDVTTTPIVNTTLALNITISTIQDLNTTTTPARETPTRATDSTMSTTVDRSNSSMNTTTTETTSSINSSTESSTTATTNNRTNDTASTVVSSIISSTTQVTIVVNSTTDIALSQSSSTSTTTTSSTASNNTIIGNTSITQTSLEWTTANGSLVTFPVSSSTSTPSVNSVTTSTITATVTNTETTTLPSSTITNNGSITSTITATVTNTETTTLPSSTITNNGSTTSTTQGLTNSESTGPNTALIIGLSVGIGGAVILLAGGIAFAKLVVPKIVHICTDRSSAYLA